jgi:predicted DNA binding CopG/RHH family protein
MKKIPKFKDEAAERRFWAEHDSTEYVDWNKAERVVLPNLKPTSTTISLRLPGMMLAELKRLANKRDVPYQSLMKMFLSERIDAELREAHSKGRPSAAQRTAEQAAPYDETSLKKPKTQRPK